MKRILVIDDEIAIQEVIRDIVEGPDCQVLTAASALDGLELARREVPDLILLDFLMPGITGMQLFHMMKESPVTAAIPIVLMSGMGADESLFSLLAFDAANYLMKPFTPVELTRKINEVSARRSQQAISAAESIMPSGIMRPRPHI